MPDFPKVCGGLWKSFESIDVQEMEWYPAEVASEDPGPSSVVTKGLKCGTPSDH